MKKLIGILIILLLVSNIFLFTNVSADRRKPIISGPKTGVIGQSYTYVITNNGWLSGSNLEYKLGYQVYNHICGEICEEELSKEILGLKTNGWSKSNSIKARWDTPGTYLVCAQVRKLTSIDDGYKYYLYTEETEYIVTITENAFTTQIDISNDCYQEDNNIKGILGESIKFYASTSNADNQCLFSWDFGDRNQGYEQTTYHTYNSPGTYQVTLKVIGQNDCTANDSIIITIEEKDVDILKIKKGKGLTTTIKTYQNSIPWKISIKGKHVFGRTFKSGEISNNSIKTIKTHPFFGFGSIDIIITLNEIKYYYTGYLIGSQIIKLQKK
jgi:hypothetical protein